MRKVIVLTFLTLDGVMQAPGGPQEDTGGDFTFGGWTFPYFDEFAGAIMGEQMGKNADLLLGRRTFEIFENYWPAHADAPGADAINDVTKYVASTTRDHSDWQKSIFLSGDVAEEVKKLKEQAGPDLQVHGSGKLIQTLLKNDLVDEMWLKIFPLTLGTGKKLFAEGTIPAAFELVDTKISPKGVIFASYRRAGAVQTGSF